MPPKKPKLAPVPTTPADVALLLHDAVVVGAHAGRLVVGRRRPHIPCGTDPALVNAECARRYVAWHGAISGEWHVDEVDPADVVPFVDRAAEIAAADERANAAQRGNIKPDGDKVGAVLPPSRARLARTAILKAP